MKFRRETPPVHGFQIAPMVDVLLVLLCFFILTWNFARKEMELDVRVPSAENGGEPDLNVNQTVLNLKADGSLVMNTKPISIAEFQEKVRALAKLNPDYAIILRGADSVQYMHVVQVLDACRAAGIWNIAFAVLKPE